MLFFEENQSFRQPWLWAFLVTALAGLLVGAVFVPNTERVLYLLIALGTIFVTLILFYFMRLSVQVDSREVRIDFRPLWKKTIPLADIVRSEARTYRPILEYGGWGIRYTWSHGWAYNVSGNQGAQLELTNGQRILIGSQRADELARAIAEAQGGRQR